MIAECDLDYNSVTGIKQLQECTQRTLMEDLVQCDDACLESLNQIRDKFYSEELVTLFSQELENSSANQIVQAIRKECLEKSISEPASTSEQDTET